MNAIRDGIEQQVHRLVGFASGEVDLDRGDAGLFGPGSAAWRVHGDFTSMMIGGIAALMLQMLHPAALAGVWDHSNFRADMRGRLRRTAQFISATTYGSTAAAESLIARVRRIHDKVAGVMPDGTAYAANDPHLLTWVHVAETSSFLAAHLRYRDRTLSGTMQDRYFAEVATIAERLGASGAPKSRAQVAAYLRDIQPELRANARTREVRDVILSEPAPSAIAAPFRAVTMDAAVDLLPAWAARLHGLETGGARRHLVRAGALGLGSIVRWALRDGSAARARRRMGVA